MSFDSKYLIRWGIPGWVFATWMLINAFTVVDPLSDILLKEANFVQIVGLLITLLSIGVPVGYLFHQLYFSWDWKNEEKDRLKPINEVLKRKVPDYQPKEDFNDNYFYIEFMWHKLLINADETTRTYLIERYRYLLSTIHGLGSLSYSLATSMILTLLFMIFGTTYENWGLGVLAFAQALLLWGTTRNQKYYSNNLISFQANFFDELMPDNTATSGEEQQNPEQPQQQSH